MLESNWNGPIPAVSEQSGVRIAKHGSSNLVGVYLMERDAADSAERGFVPVSTEPEYLNLVSSSMRNRMRADTSGLIYYQRYVFRELPEVRPARFWDR